MRKIFATQTRLVSEKTKGKWRVNIQSKIVFYCQNKPIKMRLRLPNAGQTEVFCSALQHDRFQFERVLEF